MNAIVKKALAKIEELPAPMQRSLARGLVEKIAKWQALRRDVLEGFANGPFEPWNKDEIKAEGRRRLAAKRAKK